MSVYPRFADYTMTPQLGFEGVLDVAASVADIPGDVVECGVWRGGMIAGIATVLGPQRVYHLFDSFEGLPPPDARDGVLMADGRKVAKWATPGKFATGPEWAVDAMWQAGVGDDHVFVYPGWFADTLPLAQWPRGIALARIDSDLYGPTMQCLEALWPHVNPGGVVIIDDYVFLPGVGSAVVDFFGSADMVEHLDTGTGTPVEAIWFVRRTS